ncbi:MAG: bifunctional diguanylate cyclase/phosphodiesterase, partial [Myxococcota bacterium]
LDDEARALILSALGVPPPAGVPLCTSSLELAPDRAALSVVLTDHAVEPLGVLVALDTYLDPHHRALLEGFARLAESHLRARPQLSVRTTCGLTGLPSREAAVNEIDRMLGDTIGSGQELALFIADIADFNAINSAFGRTAGDGILRAAALRIAALCPHRSYVFRHGGDQFGIALPLSDRGEEIEALISTLAVGFSEPVKFENRDVVLQLCFGTAVHPHRASSTAELFDRALIALRRAQERHTRAEVFTTELEERLVREVAVEQRLRIGLSEEAVTVAYQPKVCLSSGGISSMEALARWTDEELGFVSPGEFIPAAERTGLIVELGRQVLECALRDVLSLRRTHPGFRVSVNVAPAQLLRDDYPAEVLAALEASGAPPDALELEVVETSLIENIDRAAAIIGELRDHGVAFSIDDFGTGYSSLSYLRRLPVQTLKIDRSFINDMTASDRDAALVKSIISMAHVLDFEVVAEGVETEVQADRLRDFDCDHGQGYLWAKPAPLAAVMRYLDED